MYLGRNAQTSAAQCMLPHADQTPRPCPCPIPGGNGLLGDSDLHHRYDREDLDWETVDFDAIDNMVKDTQAKREAAQNALPCYYQVGCIPERPFSCEKMLERAVLHEHIQFLRAEGVLFPNEEYVPTNIFYGSCVAIFSLRGTCPIHYREHRHNHWKIVVPYDGVYKINWYYTCFHGYEQENRRVQHPFTREFPVHRPK